MLKEKCPQKFNSDLSAPIFNKIGFANKVFNFIFLPFRIISWATAIFIGFFITLSAYLSSIFSKTKAWHNFKKDTLTSDFSTKEAPVFLAGTIDVSMLLYKMRILWITPPALIIFITIILYTSFPDYKSISQFVYTLDSAIITETK